MDPHKHFIQHIVREELKKVEEERQTRKKFLSQFQRCDGTQEKPRGSWWFCDGNPYGGGCKVCPYCYHKHIAGTPQDPQFAKRTTHDHWSCEYTKWYRKQFV